MPYRDLEKRKEYHKQNYLKNRELILTQMKTPERKKLSLITQWKQRGLKSDDYSSLYDYYFNCEKCEECNINFINNIRCSQTKCLDHNHSTGLFRNVICLSCNVKRK
tara:strand:+ start:1101 stop:1421 length:321 start_codon:yes stop_codon:yes gene_type:complete